MLISGRVKFIGSKAPLHKQRGVTLIELMIGLTVGALVMAGAITLFAKISFSGLENTRAMRLNQQLRETMDYMRRDLQRAGYVSTGATVVDSAAELAAMGSFGAITIGANCVAYSYDLLEDATQDNSDLLGFRLNNGVLQSGTNVADCGGGGNWEGISDVNVTITSLTFALAPSSIVYEANGDGVDLDGDGFADCESGEICLARRKIDIVLVGELSSDGTVTTSLRDDVKVKNDHYYTMP